MFKHLTTPILKINSKSLIINTGTIRRFNTSSINMQFSFITKQQVEQLIKEKTPVEDFILIDVREPSEFNSSELPPIHSSAYNIPVGDLGPAFLTLDNKQFKQTYGKLWIID